MSRVPYRWLWFAFVAAFVLVVVVGARATNPPPSDQALLNEAASWMANHPVTVICLGEDEPNSPADMGAWGYTYLFSDEIYLDDIVCSGFLAVAHKNFSAPRWQQALGILVLTHEAFHQRLNLSDRGNEATTECRAIRHFAYMAYHIGATQNTVAILRAFALAEHYHLELANPQYQSEDCELSWYW